MSRSLRFVRWLAAVPLLGLLACSSPSPDDGPEPDAPETTSARSDDLLILLAPATVRVPGDAPTIQAAVDTVRNGGTVQLAATTYTETVWISGKRVTIAGATGGGTVLRAGGQDFGALNFLQGGGGEVRDLVVMNAQSGVMGYPSALFGKTYDASLLPAAVTLRRVGLPTTVHGVSGQFGTLALVDSWVWGTSGDGLALDGVRSLSLTSVTVNGTGGAGLRATLDGPTACAAVINGSQLSYNAREGVALLGGTARCPVWLTDTTTSWNHRAGIFVQRTGAASVLRAQVAHTEAADGLFGDGIVTMDADLSVRESVVQWSRRAGISAFRDEAPLSVLLSDDTLLCNAFDIDVEGGATPTDAGGNTCSGVVGGVCGATRSCHGSSSSLEPIPVTPP